MSPTFYSYMVLFGISVLGLITPGPDFIMVTNTSLIHSTKAGLQVVAGILVSNFIFIVCSLLGIEIVFELFPEMKQLIEFLGAVYLFYLGIQSIRGAWGPQLDKQEFTVGKKNKKTFFQIGFLTSFLNPKAFLFITGVLTSLLQLEASAATLWIFCSAMIVSSGLWFSAVVLLFSAPRLQHKLLHYKRALNFATGGVLSLFAISLMWRTVVG